MTDRIGRNEKCPCGSGEKYKKCCLDRDLKDDPVAVQPPPVIEVVRVMMNVETGQFQIAANAPMIVQLNDPSLWGAIIHRVADVVSQIIANTPDKNGDRVPAKSTCLKQIQHWINDNMNQTGIILPGGGDST